jgi:NAD(P)H-quinone oxidoreductase subunit 5
VFGFTVVVMGLVAADHVALFGVLWLAMGLAIARLIGINAGWKQARVAATLARKYFVASSTLLGAGFILLWWETGKTTISGIAAATDTLTGPVWLIGVGALVLAAMLQSALIPFHTWLLASMTAPTPASALMHAGFVNAGGILLVRFAPVVSLEPTIMLLIVVVGAVSALLGKLFKSVQADTKTRLGSSTVGQMGFMIMQAGLGFFGAAITHLILHGCYKAYLFLSAGEEIEHTSPAATTSVTGSTGPVGVVVTVLAGVAGGVLFALLTGKGTALDSGLLLTGLVVITTLHATRSALRHSAVPTPYGFGVVVVFLPAIAVYALVYNGFLRVMADLPVTTPTELTLVHGVVAIAFLSGYVAIETGLYRRNDRLYVVLVNATMAPFDTLVTSREEYNEY